MLMLSFPPAHSLVESIPPWLWVQERAQGLSGRAGWKRDSPLSLEAVVPQSWQKGPCRAGRCGQEASAAH